MAHVVRMPKLGLSMVEGVVSEWLVADGDTVEEGDLVLGVETSKINYQVEAPASGVVRRIVAAPQEVVAVGGALCVIGGADEVIDFAEITRSAAVPAAALPGGFDASTTKLGAGATAFASTEPEASVAPSPGPDIADAPGAAPPDANGDGDGTRVKASPVARKLARMHGLALATVQGNGPGGRIEKRDVEAAVAAATPAVPPSAARVTQAAPEVAPVPLAVEVMRRAPDRGPLAGMRRVIADNMRRSRQVAAHATMSLRADMTELISLREELNAEAGPDERITFTDLFVKAIARVLVGNPMMRTVIDGDELVTLNDIDISVAVHLGEAGLIVPVIRDCERRGLRDISRERRRLVEAGRAGRLDLDDMTGGCFTLTNMGAVYDLDFGTPIINLPQSAILGVGSIAKEAVVVDDALAIRPTMRLFLSIDHRVIDGEPAVRFLNQVRDVLTDPRSGFALH